jgi:hypothetical protein
MLVCRQCGTEVVMSGRPCPACGAKGAVDSRFYQGEPHAAPPELVQALAADVNPVSAWSPWLATVLALVAGPAAGVLFAADNLRRLGRPHLPTRRLVVTLVVAQIALSVLSAWLCRHHPGRVMLLPGLFALGVAVWLYVWQDEPVQAWRKEHPGPHVPGADAFGACVASVALGVVVGVVVLLLGNKVGAGAMSAALKALVPAAGASGP